MSQRTRYYGPGPWVQFQMRCRGCGAVWWSQPRTEVPRRCPKEGCRLSDVEVVSTY